MSRATGMAYIEKLQQQLEAAKQKEAERAAKKAEQVEAKIAELDRKIEDENDKFEKRIEQVTQVHNDRVTKLQAQRDALTNPMSQLSLEVVTDDDNSDDAVAS